MNLVRPCPAPQPCEVLVVHCDSSKETRLREYLINAFPFLTLMPPPADYQPETREERKRLKLAKVGLIFLKPKQDGVLRDLLTNQLFPHPFLYRYVKAYYLCSHVASTLEFLKEIAQDCTETSKVLRIALCPKILMDEVMALLPRPQVLLHPKNFTHYLSIVCAHQRYYYGIELRQYFWSLETAVHSVPLTQVSRAYHKLREVFLTVDALANADKTNWTALDVGSAPGGWTQYLSPIVQRVISVDPGDLRIDIPANVTYYKQKVEDCMDKLKQHEYDFLGCDMNCSESQQALDLMLPLMPLLKPGGFLVMTWKLQKRVESNLDERARLLTEAFMQQFPSFRVVKVVWLLANIYERTLVAVKL